MSNIYIWGTSKRSSIILSTVKVEIKGFLDSNIHKCGKEYLGYKIFNPKIIFADKESYPDIIIIAANDIDSVRYQINELDKNSQKVTTIPYWEEQNFIQQEYGDIFDYTGWQIAQLRNQIEVLKVRFNYMVNNIKYEMIDDYDNGRIKIPRVIEGKKAIERIVNEGCSLVRFGDGEFEIMAGHERPNFQNYDRSLSERLLLVFQSYEDKLLVAIANNYGSLSQYTYSTANGIREYMTNEVRAYHESIIDFDRKYYDAYMFKAYMPYRDKKNTQVRVDEIKKIWNGRDIAIIEGSKTRAGVKNDLFDNAKSISRLLCPTKNAFSKYEQILDEALKIEKSKLILIILGPAGKLLTYDMFMKGYQVVDIGQIDMDYDWYKANLGYKIPSPYKYVSQQPETEISDVNDEPYISQIICEIK